MNRPLDPGALLQGSAVQALSREFYKLWGADPHAKRNPCPQPVSLERKHLQLLKQDNYVVADKSDGTRYTLFLTRVMGRQFSVLIDRKMDAHQIPVAASRRVFEGSVFDGELVWAYLGSNPVPSQLFLIFDVIAYRGSNAIRNESLHKRLQTIRAVFDLDGRSVTSPEDAATLAREGKIVCGGNAHGLSFRPKGCFPVSQLDTLLRQIPALPYATDGLMFTPVQAPVQTGTSETTFKLKNIHTIDLEVKERSFLVGLGGAPETAVQRVPLSSLGLPLVIDEGFWQAFARQHQSMKNESDAATSIVECIVELSTKEDVVLKLHKIRTDKTHPNTVRTILATLTNLKENIQISELRQVLQIASLPGSAHSFQENHHGDTPKPVCADASSHGGAILATLTVGDLIDSQTPW